MRSIPTDLLRAFVTVIDLRGYTRAGEQLGRTQPAISLQMKKLQELLGVSLFAKEGGAQPTEHQDLERVEQPRDARDRPLVSRARGRRHR